MASTVQNVPTFTAPPDWQAQQADIARRQLMAQKLMEHGQEPLGGTQSIGGVAIPQSWTQGAAKALQQGVGAWQQGKLAKEQRDLYQGQQSAYAHALDDYTKATTPRAAVPGQPESNDENGFVNPATPDQPAYTPSIYDMGNAATAAWQKMGQPGMALQNAMTTGQQRMLMAQLLGGNATPPAPAPPPDPQSGGATLIPGQPNSSIVAGAPGTEPVAAPQTPPAAPPAAAPTVGGLPRNLAMSLMLADPTGKLLAQQQAEMYKQSQAPLNVRPGGTVATVGPDGNYRQNYYSPVLAPGMTRDTGGAASIVPGFAGAREGLNGIPNPGAPAVNVPLSEGQTAQLTQPEWIEYNRTHQLPARFGQQPAGMVPGGQINPDGTTQPAAPITQIPPSQAPQARAAGVQVNAPPAPPQRGALGTPGLTQSQEEQNRQSGQQASNTEAGKEFIKKQADNYEKLRDVPATLANMDRAKQLAAGQAATFMGPLGESKLAITKFLRANVPGMGNLDTSGVTNAEELQSTLFNQVMDNLKKMDASPSQYQQQVMQEAFGTLRTDPKSVPRIIDVFSDILRNRVKIHNDTVTSAESRGTMFPYDVKVNLPEPKAGNFNVQQLIDEAKRRGLAK